MKEYNEILTKHGYKIEKDFEYEKGRSDLWSKGSHLIQMDYLTDIKVNFYFIGDGLSDKVQTFGTSKNAPNLANFEKMVVIYTGLRPLTTNQTKFLRLI